MGKASVGLCVVGAILAGTPVLRAWRVARDLPSKLTKAFGVAVPIRPSALVYADLFSGISQRNVRSEVLVYGKAAEMELSLDFYRAESSVPAPLIVVIHGGSWNSGDNKDFIPLNQYLAGRGFAVADVLYRLAPRWHFPAASDDVRAAIEFLKQRADSLKIDPNRIVLLGRSSGGQIALNVAYSTKDPAIRGAISFYGPMDLRWSWDHPGSPLVIDTRAVLSDYLGGSPSEVWANYDAASPIRFVNAGTPPTLLFHGDRDELVFSYHSNALSRRLTEAGVPNLDVALPWATHGFDYIFRGPGGQISTYAIEYFLSRVLK